MALYAIADLHLSFGTDKNMDVFNGWSNYTDRLKKNWEQLVKKDDTVVIAGDLSWALKLEETYEDFKFLNMLPGKKILIKGNHDYWWGTKKKIDTYLSDNGFDSISILFNNSIKVGSVAVCGTRGWSYDCTQSEDIKILKREVGRLQTSIQSGKKMGLEPIVFLHYPPIFGEYECSEIMEVLISNDIKTCYYGHIHGKNTAKKAITGQYKGINFYMVSADNIDFCPVLVR